MLILPCTWSNALDPQFRVYARVDLLKMARAGSRVAFFTALLLSGRHSVHLRGDLRLVRAKYGECVVVAMSERGLQAFEGRDFHLNDADDGVAPRHREPARLELQG